MLKTITSETHGVVIEMAYFTDNNITGKPIYESDICKLHIDAECALNKAISRAKCGDLTLKIFDAYRPSFAQEKLWNFLPDPLYVMPPFMGSSHTRGIAVDLTLVDKSGSELDMGTKFDDMSDCSHHFSRKINADTHKNRLILLGIMLSSGFDMINGEWWHYELPNALSYPLL